MKIKVSERILIIGDTHLGKGTSHPDYLQFLVTVRDHYETDTTIHIGDVGDWSSISYHEDEFWSVSPDVEREEIVKHTKEYWKQFPDMYICLGNHDMLPERKLKTFKLPRAMLGSDYNYLVGGPDTWVWGKKFEFRLTCGIKCVAAHSFSGSWTAFGKMADTCALIQGHHHTMAGVSWSYNPHGKTFAMATGCGINPSHPVFNYSRNGRGQLVEPLLGCGVILNGAAYWLPMWTNKNGRWNKELP